MRDRIMYIFGNLLFSIARILDIILTIYMWVIIVRALISWVNPDPFNPIVRFLVNVTEPVLARVRRGLPTWRTGIDFSPFIVILAILFLKGFVVRSLFQLAGRL